VSKQVDELMKLAENYWYASCQHGTAYNKLKSALETALGQPQAVPTSALTPGEPVAIIDVTYSKHSGLLESYALRKVCDGAPSGVYAVYAAPPAQTPPSKGLFVDLIAQHPGLAEELKVIDDAPMPAQTKRLDSNESRPTPPPRLTDETIEYIFKE
jgi:hypothetical protein